MKKLDFLGIFAIYHGIECQMNDHEEGTVMLATDDSAAIKYDFSERLPGWFVKDKIRSIDIDCVYLKSVKGLYREKAVWLLFVAPDGEINIGAAGSDWEIYKNLGFTFRDRGVYDNKVLLEEISEIVEIRKPMIFVGKRWEEE